VFGPATLSLLVILLIASVIARQTALALLALALLLAAGLSCLYERHALSGLTFRRRLSQQQAAFGERIEMEVEIINGKPLPLAWIEVQDELPRDLLPERGQVHLRPRPGRPLLLSAFALRPYERLRRRYHVVCRRRGEHLFGPVLLRTGDLFGLIAKETTVEAMATLVVYPQVLALGDLGLPSYQPLGDLRVQSWIFDDPSRIAGAREHQPGDSLRRIHWAATARTQRLQSRVYEATTSQRLLLCLNVQTIPGGGPTFDYDPNALELTISTAASIAVWALDRGMTVGLASNGMHRLSPALVRVAARDDAGQRTRLLQALGRLQPLSRQAFTTTLRQVADQVTFGDLLVVISATHDAPLLTTLAGLRRRGQPVALIGTGRRPPPAGRDGVVVRWVGPPDAWATAPGIDDAERHADVG
jgi:uncharacterized protein (DUF58 family)